VDADWASDINDHKSTSGFIFFFAGSPISWSSKKQMSIALSSTKAKYIAAMHTTKEALWLQHLLTNFGISSHLPTTLYINNQSTIAIAHNPKFHNQTKHINIHYHFLHKKIKDNEVKLNYILTNNQITNIFMKGLVQDKHDKFFTSMGLHHTD
jgi:hypothetical protein